MQWSWNCTSRPKAETIVGGADVFHSTDLAIAPSRLPTVATVHDLVALEHPGLHSRRAAAQQRARLAGLDRARVVLAVSHATAKALVDHGVDAGRITVVPNGVTPLPEPGPAPVHGPYLLAVGEVMARKGYDVLVRAFARAQLGPARLVIAGPAGASTPELVALARKVGVDDRLVLLGAVGDATLSSLYAHALALCFPSVAEGFGLPVLEALAAGLPAVVTDIAVLREVAGEAAVFVAPADEAAWTAALAEITEDADLRSRLAAMGPKQAARFSWTDTAAATLGAYRQALACG